MAGYQPISIAAYEQGLIQKRQDFILPNDAFPVLENALVFRESLRRKSGWNQLGRLRRAFVLKATPNYSIINGTTPFSILPSLYTGAAETNASIEIGSLTNISIAFSNGQTLTNTSGSTTMTVNGAGLIKSATINYATGIVSITGDGVSGPLTTTFTGAYYPTLPTMGCAVRETDSINNEQSVIFDTKYAYVLVSGQFQQFDPGSPSPSTQWTGTDAEFFWSTNYWTDKNNAKVFWVSNTLKTSGDPIRYVSDSSTVGWINFAPIINAANDRLNQALMIFPFRNRMMALNTLEGLSIGTSTQYRQRVRWAAIGNPFSEVTNIITTVSVDAWRDDVRGKGGFLDIPTSENIIASGFVRDNLVIYCERSTWQLRYTGNQIAPFQIEKVNTELGCESTFSGVQFDTSLVGVGDKGVVECDSFKSSRIDTKIIDLVYSFNNKNSGPKRVHGIRDIRNKCAYWIYPNASDRVTFPNRRLVYNYENQSWAIYTDSLTCLGLFQPPLSKAWEKVKTTWSIQNYAWSTGTALLPLIIGGNQQGFVLILDQQVSNDPSLSIDAVTINGSGGVRITSTNHNLLTDQVIKITGIATGSGYTALNDGIFGIVRVSANAFDLFTYNATTKQFSDQYVLASSTYGGGGVVSVRDGFRILSRKFENMQQGQKIQVGYVDVLMDSTSDGAVTLNVYNDYLNSLSVNNTPDTFFNSVVPTSPPRFTAADQEKYWHRVYCASRANFLQFEWTLSNAQLAGIEQESEVQISAQTIWQRSAGRQTI